MIKKTFYNLGDAKKQRVTNAILHEFAGPDNGRVSINRIIESAGISRGSFYQYFDDKIDLVEVVLRNFADQVLEKCMKDIEESNGNVFYVYGKMFDYIIELGNDGESAVIIKNLMLSMRSGGTLVNEYMRSRFSGFEKLRDITSEYSRENFRFKSDDDMRSLQQLLDAALLGTLFKYYVCERELEPLRDEYRLKLAIIEQGAVLR